MAESLQDRKLRYAFLQLHKISLPYILATYFRYLATTVQRLLSAFSMKWFKKIISFTSWTSVTFFFLSQISDDNTKSAAVIDPVSPDLVLEEVNKRGLSLQSILTTHHHWFVFSFFLPILMGNFNKIIVFTQIHCNFFRFGLLSG